MKTIATTMPHQNGAKEGLESISADGLQAVAAFLPKTQCALLAVALTAPSSSFREKGWEVEPRASGKAVIASVKPTDPYTSLLPKLCAGNYTDKKRPNLKWRHKREDFRDGLDAQLKLYYLKQWEVLDFADIEKSLAIRLTDDDIGALLVCIDAKNNLKVRDMNIALNFFVTFYTRDI